MYIYNTLERLVYNKRLILAFNPIPFIRTFEGAVDKLISLRKDVQAKSEQMEKSVKVAEREYSKKMSDLNKGFEVCLSLRNRERGFSDALIRRLGNLSLEWRIK